MGWIAVKNDIAGLETLELRLLLSATLLSLDDVAPDIAQVRTSPAIVDSFTGPGETDSFEVTLDTNESLTVAISPLDPSLLASVTVTPPAGSPTTVSAAGADLPAIIQSLAAAAGTYAIDVSNVSGTGSYTIRATTNASAEAEQAGGQSNDATATAQSLDASVTPIPSTLGGSRFAVRGRLDPSDTDVYALSLTAGQSLSAAIKGLSHEAIQIDLLDPSGNLLTQGARNADTVDAWIKGFVAPSSGTYYLRVTGYAAEPYTLFGTLDADLGLEPDDVNFAGQTLTDNQPMLGNLGDGAGVGTGSVMTTDLYYEPNDTIYDAGYVDFYESEAWQLTGEIGDNFDLSDPLSDVDIIDLGYLEPGTVFTADLDSSEIGYGLDARLRLFNSYGDEVATSDDDPAPGESPSLDPYIEWTVDYDDNYYLGVSSYDNADYDYEYEESGSSPGTTEGYYELTLAINGAASNADSDQFDVAVNPNDNLTVTVNGLADDMAIQLDLLDSVGNVVASDAASGSANAVVTFTVPGAAAPNERYAVRITSQTDAQGDYVVRVDGATGTTDPSVSTIATTVLFPDELPDYVSFPPSAYVYFDANLDPASVDPGDLTITDPSSNVLSANAVQIRDGGALVFDIAINNPADGDYILNIADGALTDLNGQAIHGYTRTITYRQVGPRVISSTLSDGDVISPGGLNHTVEFSQPLLDFVSAGFFGYLVLTGEDVELTNLLTNEVRNPTNFSYSASPTPHIDTVFTQLDEGVYELRYLATVPASFYSYTGDEIHISGEDGFPLDGSPSNTLPSGDGQIGDDFVLHFSVDRPDNFQLPAFHEIGPAGDLAYTHDPLRAAIGEAGDVDTFVLNADADQTLSLRVDALAAELQLHVRVLDPGGAVLLDTTTTSSGDQLLIQPTVLPVSGQYIIEVTSASGLGGYELQATINAALQTAGNDSIANAQSLDDAAIALGNDGERLAVTGSVTGTPYHDSQTITGTAFSPNLLTYNFTPGPDPLGDVTLTFNSNNPSLYGEDNYFEVTLEGVSQHDVYVYYSPSTPATLTLSAQAWRELTADGQATIRVKPSDAVTGDSATALTVDVDYTTVGNADYYKLSLTAGQSLDAAAEALNGSGVAFQLLNSSGDLLAAGFTPDDGPAGITGFTAPSDGDYILRVVGDGDYTLVATRGALFDLEQTGDRNLTEQVALGALGHAPVDGRTIRIAHLDSPDTGGSGNDVNRLINQLNDSTVFNFDAVRVEAGDLTTAADLAAFDVIVTGGVSELRDADGLGALLRDYVESGGGLVIVGDAPSRSGASTSLPAATDLDAVSPIYLSSARENAPGDIQILDTDHPITAGLTTVSPNYYTAGTRRGAVGKPGAVVLGRSSGIDTVAYRYVGAGGRSVYLAPVYEADYTTSSPLRSGAPDQLLEQAVAWAAESGDVTDRYTLDLAEGQSITVQTAVPAADAGEPANNLDPALTLIDPSGNVVAGDSNSLDGRNAIVSYTVPAAAAGTYTIAVSNENLDAGTYVLLVNGPTTTDALGPSVVTTAPFDGQRFAQPPTQLTLTFDEAIDLTTVDTADLTLDNGATVTGFEVIDGRTIRYQISVPDVAGDFGFTLAAGAVTDLAGNANTQASGGFTIDRTGPKVIAQTPGTQAAAPFNTITLTFDEPLDADTVSIEDVTSFTGPGGTDLLSAIQSVYAQDDQVVVTFNDQLALGTYTLTLGPDITDAVGQPMDQDASGTGGEATDTFTASLTIQSPNLTVQSITPGGPAQFGSTLDLTYTIENSGTDDAVEGWVDRIYLSTDDTLDYGDRMLLQVDATDEAPLLAGDTYTRTVTVNLPLTDSFSAGDYHILIKTDYNNTQPEDSELDNVGTTGPIAISLPALPDLVVTQITLPSSPQQTGGPIDLSWTVQNQGDGEADGTLYDDIYLSSDTGLSGYTDRYLGRFARTGTIAPGESIVRTQQVDIPIELAGDWYIIIRTDGGNQFYEHVGEDNNVAASDTPITLVLPPLPDLTVSDVTAPTAALSNELVTVTWTVHNDGPDDFVGQFTDRIALSPDTFPGGDQSLGDFVFDGAIPAGGSVTRSANVLLPADLSGDRYIVVTTDYDNDVYEDTGESNNTAVSGVPIAVTRSPFPNLVVSLVTAPNTIFSGQQFDVTWRVTNIGDAPTSAATWKDQLYLSTNGTIDGQDTHLGSIPTPAFLNPGESYEQTMTVTVPDGVQGPRYVLVATDSNHRVFELNNEGDNVGVSELIDAQLTPPPDLQVVNVDAPSAAFSGQPMTLRWTVGNEGLGDTVADRWFDRVWFSADDTLDSADILLGEFVHDGALNAGDTYLAEQAVALPTALTGPYYFIVQTDRRDQVFEFAFEGNNVGFDPTPTDVLLTPPPDLATTAVTAPTDAEAGRLLNVSYHVDNDGATATPNDHWTDRVYLSLDGVFDPSDDTEIGQFLHRDAIQPGEGYDVNLSLRIPDGISGTYTLFVVADQSNLVFELDNDNNIATPLSTIDIALTPPDLVVTQVDAPAIAAAGAGLTLSFDVQNQGLGDTTTDLWYDDIYLSSTGDVTGATRLKSVRHNDGLALNDHYTVDLASLDIPLSFSPGDYSLIISVDSHGDAYELDDANNLWVQPITIVRDTADLVVSDITPIASAFSGQDTDFQWTVTNQGTAATNATAWNDLVYLSTDPALGGAEDILIGQFQQTNPLGAGQSYTRLESIHIPDGLTGDYYIVIQTDNANRVFEADAEDNNITPADAVTSITPAPAADLVVEAVDIPETAYSGRTVNITYTTHNVGTAGVNKAVYESVYLSADRLFDPSDKLIATSLDPLSLAPGESREVTLSGKLPVGVTGSYYVLVRTDASDRVYETQPGELNNIGYEEQVLDIALAPPVDLVAGAITVPVSANAGQNATITYSVTNDGPNTALGPWTDTLYLSTDTQWDINDKRFAEVMHNGNVLADDTYSGTATAPLPGLLPGDYYVIVRSDILNQVIETDETNNASASLDAFALDIPTLTLDNATTVTLQASRFNYFLVDLPDDQTFVLDVDALGADVIVDLFARREDVPARDRFDYVTQNPLQANSRLVIPDTTGGRYYIGVYGTSVPSGAQDIQLTARLVPFSILDTGYGQAGNAGNRTLQINGARFDRTIQAHLLNPNGVDRAATAMYPVNEARTYATFDLRDLAPGLYDIQITKADGSTDTLTDAIEVVDGGGGTNTPRLIGPSAVTIASRQFSVTAAWGNDGLNDALAPLLYVEASNLIGDLGDERSASEMTFYGAGLDDGPAGILRPDQASSRPLSSAFAGSGVATSTTIIDRLVEDKTQAFDWESLRDTLPRFDLDDATYNAAFDQLIARNGPTWGDYLAMLSRNANLLPAELGDNRSPADLTALELQFAAADLGSGIVGQIFAPDFGVDISGVKVSASDADTGDAYTTRSLNDGTFVFFNMKPGHYTFTVEGGRVIDDPQVTATVVAGLTTRHVLIHTDAGIAVAKARVLDGDTLTGMANVFITLYNEDGDAVFQTATDLQGYYDMSLAPSGTYRAVIHPDQYVRTVIDAFVIEPGVTLPDITLGHGTSVTGTFDFTGVPIGSETFILAAPDLSDPTQDVLQYTTNATFAFSGLNAGTYTFWFFSGESGRRIDNVVIGGSGLVDLGTITLNPPPPSDAPSDAPSSTQAQTSTTQEGETSGGFVSIIDAEKAWPNTGNSIYTPQGEVLEALERVDISLHIDWITAATVRWGRQTAQIWLEYLDSSPDGPPSRQTYTEFSQIAEGSSVADGFLEQPELNTSLNTAEGLAGAYFRQAFRNGKYSIDEILATGPRYVMFDEIDPAFKATNGDSNVRLHNYDHLFDIPGNLAGGAGSPGQGPGQGGGLGQVYTDIREVKGFATLTAVNNRSVRVDYFVYYSAADTVDFVPGNPGKGVEQIVTRRLWALELFGQAFDVPFIVEYDLHWDDILITEQPRSNPGSPDGRSDFTLTTLRHHSGDPNDILGPEGFGVEQFVPASQPLDYTVQFENDPALANAPAQEITITSPLDDSLDARTFRLGDIQLSDTIIDVPDDLSFYQTRLDLTETLGVYVDVFAGVNLQTNEAFWRFTSIDPETGELPIDPLLGLLPVNDDTGAGEGFVKYSVQAKDAAVTGDIVDAQATIVFDVNGPIDTPAISNTLDTQAPASAVDALPDTAAGESFNVTWSGLDESNGSGIASYDVYVSFDGNAYELWLDQTTQVAATFNAQAGHTYAFYSVARDNAGNIEQAPDIPDAVTVVPGSGDPPAISGYQVNPGGSDKVAASSIKVLFNLPVNLAAGAFELTRTDTNEPVAFTTTIATNRRSVTLDFSDTPLAGGLYELHVNASAVTSDLGAMLAADGTFNFHRLLGDVNGDQYVGLDDLAPILQYWSQNVPTGDLSHGDLSGDGFVGVDDLQIILNNWNVSLVIPTATQSNQTQQAQSQQQAPQQTQRQQPQRTQQNPQQSQRVSQQAQPQTQTWSALTSSDERPHQVLLDAETRSALGATYQQNQQQNRATPWSTSSDDQTQHLGLWDDTATQETQSLIPSSLA